MKDEVYISPIILSNLEKNFVNKSILRNPRCSEINDIIVNIAKTIGNLTEDIGSMYYEKQIMDRMEGLLSSPGFLEVNDYGNIIIRKPQYRDSNYTKDETYIYELLESGELKRTIDLDENGILNRQIKIESYMDEEGIEQKRIITKQGKGRVIIQREKQNPLVTKVISRRREEYYDISSSDKLQDVEIVGAKRISKEEVTDLEEVDKIRAWEKFRQKRYKYPFYEEGIRRMLGIQEEVGNSEKIK